MKYKLKIEQNFIDKYDETKEYKVGEIHEFNEKRGKELLNDSRKLVSLEKEIKENKSNKNDDKNKSNENDELNDDKNKIEDNK